MGDEKETVVAVPAVPEKKPGTMLTVDLGELGSGVLRDMQMKIKRETGKMPSKALVVRRAIIGHYALDLYREPERIIALYEAQYGTSDYPEPQAQETALNKPAPKGKGRGRGMKSTDADRQLVDVYVETYSLPNKKGIFWPVLLSAVAKALEAGYTYQDLEGFIKISPDEEWIAEKYTQASLAPPIHVLFGEKVLARLVALSATKQVAGALDSGEPANMAVAARKRRDQHLREIRNTLGPVVAGKFYRKATQLGTPAEVDALRLEVFREYGTSPEDVARKQIAARQAEEEKAQGQLLASGKAADEKDRIMRGMLHDRD